MGKYGDNAGKWHLKNEKNNEEVHLKNKQNNEKAHLKNDQEWKKDNLENNQKRERANLKNDKIKAEEDLADSQAQNKLFLKNDQSTDRKNLKKTQKEDRQYMDLIQESERKDDDFRRFIVIPEILLVVLAIFLLVVGVAVYSGYSSITGYTTKIYSDLNAPDISYTDPVNGAVNVPTNSVIYIAFDEAIKPSSIGKNSFTLTGPDGILVAGTVKMVGRTWIFTPNNDLSPNTRYTAWLFAGVKDLGDNMMNDAVKWFFTTGSTPSSNMVLFKRYSSIDIEVEDNYNIGSFSVGGLYGNGWKPITYNYPNTWSGTFLTVNVDGKLYSTSEYPKNGILMDEYNTYKPRIFGSAIRSEWVLPQNIRVIQEWLIVQNTTVITRIKLVNNDDSSHSLGARLIFDTKVDTTDGAVIFIPGNKVLTKEREFYPKQDSISYWKAFNHEVNPTVVATGFLDEKDGMTTPNKLVVADWKTSKDTAWDYNVQNQRTILDDSAVLIYYNPAKVGPGYERIIRTGYGLGEIN